MKFSVVVLAAAATFVSAIDFPGQPPCASPCISQAITQGSPCGIEDVACQCISSNFDGISNAVIPCIIASCTGTGEIASAQAAPNRCDAAAVTTAASSESSSAASETTSSASPASTTSSGPESTTGTESTSETSTAAPTTTAAAGGGGGNATFTTSSPSSTAGQVTQNVAHSVGFAGMGGFVGLLAAAVAAL